MVEKANSKTKRVISSLEKPKKSSKKTTEATPSKSTERVETSDDESGSSSGEDEPQETVYKYTPPENFTPLSADANRSSNPFSAANLKGKELWFITAPANAPPLSKLTSVDAADITKANPVLETKNGRSFCLKTDNDTLGDGSALAVLAPDARGVYREAGIPITRSLRLVESLPKAPKITQDQIPDAKPIRLQPEGLKMRYRPFGADEIAQEAADVDAMDIDESSPAVEAMPERKKKRSKTEDGEKKKKKKNKSKEVSA